MLFWPSRDCEGDDASPTCSTLVAHCVRQSLNWKGWCTRLMWQCHGSKYYRSQFLLLRISLIMQDPFSYARAEELQIVTCQCMTHMYCAGHEARYRGRCGQWARHREQCATECHTLVVVVQQVLPSPHSGITCVTLTDLFAVVPF